MQIYKCDRCGKTEPEKSRNTKPEGWVILSYNISSNCGNRYDYKDICPECAIALKLPTPIHCPEVGERIIEIIEGIIRVVIENQ